MPQKRDFFVSFQLPQNRHFVQGDLNQVQRFLFCTREAEVVAGLIKLVKDVRQQASAGTDGGLIGGHALDLDAALFQVRVNTLEVNFLELD